MTCIISETRPYLGKKWQQKSDITEKRVVQKSYNSRRRVLERNRRSKGIYRKRSMRSNKTIGRRLEIRKKDNTIEKKILHSRFSYAPRRSCHKTPWLQTSWISRIYQNIQINNKKLLVALDIRRYQIIHGRI